MGHALSLHLRRMLAYRADFWVDFLGALLLQVGLAWFLWKAMFAVRGTQQIEGWSFDALMLYYLMVPLMERITRGQEQGFLSTEIYDGGLSRYLVYPINVFTYKYIERIAVAVVGSAQLALVLGIYLTLRDVPAPFSIDGWGVLAGLLAALVASILYFLMAAGVEMVAFWADNVWSLMVLLRFCIRLLGGGMIPLALFPHWSQSLLDMLPFASLLSFPIRAFLGELSPAEYFRSMAMLVGWIGIFSLLTAWIWRRGTLRYTGIGM
jgi:ABC-2 type transport system permease protein